MPLTKKGEKILAEMIKEYGEEKGKEVFYASKNSGKITGVDSAKHRFYVTSQISDNWFQTPDGYVVIPNVPIARTGEYLYKPNDLRGEDGKPFMDAGPDGYIHVQRDPDEVFSSDTLKSFEGKPITIDHPDDFVTPENWPSLANGAIHNVRQGEGDMDDLALGDLFITTEKAIELIKAGVRELSCGYDADYEKLGNGRARQKGIIGNHVAIVSQGRAGSRCKIMDKACSGCGNCSCGKKTVEDTTKEVDASMKLKQKTKDYVAKIKKWVDEFPQDMPQEGAEGERNVDPTLEGIATAVGEIKADVAALSAEEGSEKKDKEPEADPGIEKDSDGKVGDTVEEMIADLDARLARIEALLEEDEDDEPPGDEGGTHIKDDEGGSEEEKKKKEDEEKEKEDKEEFSKIEFQDVISRAEVLAPGTGASVRPPTKDRMKAVDTIMIDAIEQVRKENVPGVEALLKGKDLKTMTRDSLSVSFIAASEIVSTMRNAKVHDGKLSRQEKGATTNIADLNKKNKEFWFKQNGG